MMLAGLFCSRRKRTLLHFLFKSNLTYHIICLIYVDLAIQGKKVAVFGLGDQISYGENYADASGEVRILSVRWVHVHILLAMIVF